MMRKYAATALILFFLVGASRAQKAGLTFNLEQTIENSVTVPADVMAVLKSDSVVDGCFREKGAGTDENAWFEAAETDLNGDNRPDLIIKGRNACLFGANVGPFWVFQNRPDGWQKVFRETGLQLTVMPGKKRGFREIQMARATATKTFRRNFRFSGGKYRLVK